MFVLNVFNVRLLHAVAFSKKLHWLAQTNVITSKTQTHVLNARIKRTLKTRVATRL